MFTSNLSMDKRLTCYRKWSKSMVPRPVAAALLGILFDVQIMGPNSEALNQKLWRGSNTFVLTTDFFNNRNAFYLQCLIW